MVSGDRVRIEVLGPLRVTAPGGSDLTPTGALQRRLLALLVLRRGRVVPAGSAIEVLWPSTLPDDPTGALQNHLSRLRRQLPGGLLASVGEGYRIDPSAIEVDADALTGWLAEGSTIHASTLATVETALDRWRGPAYPELDDVDEARTEAVRLEELRIRAREACAEHRLLSGQVDGVAAEVAALVEAEPLRERPRALLMEALEATGRHVEALRVFDDFRRLLGDELGIAPSRELAAHHERLLAGAAAPVRHWQPPHRLPVPTTSLVGREDVASEVVALVGSHRLVSLVGPGGVGKTRLLLEVGGLLGSARPERAVVLCELASADGGSATEAVAASLGIDARPGTDLGERVATVLGGTPVILLVDNCEHVIDPIAALVHHLLQRCPGLTVVATSRERLRVPAEQVCPVPVLPVDGDDAPAVRLFVERARAAVIDFGPDARQVTVIADIVRRLDGLPLAIELAAARLFTHDVDEVASGLDHRFSLLTSGNRASPRHASLGAAVAWSHGLLSDPLQRVFAALSVFAGSFTADDAAAVCDLGRDEVADALRQLQERSLVTRTPDRRYVLLETLRAFGSDQLRTAGGDDAVAERHARHQLDWVAAAEERMLASGSTAITEIDTAVPELRAALTWFLARGEVEHAGQLVAPLFEFGFLRLRPDVLAWAEQVIAADPHDRSPVAPRMWVLSAYAAWMAGDVPRSGELSRRALSVAEAAGGQVAPDVWSAMASYELFEGNLERAADLYRRAANSLADAPGRKLLAAASELLTLGYAGNPTVTARTAELLDRTGATVTPHAAYAWYCAGETVLTSDPSLAEERFVRALALAEQTSASLVTGLAGASRASIAARLGDPGDAARQYRWLIDHWRRAGMWATQWTMLRSIAGLLAELGRPRDAAVLAGAIWSTGAGHRIFGADEVALRQLDLLLRGALGDDAYEAALAEGALLDGDAAAEHALRAL